MSKCRIVPHGRLRKCAAEATGFFVDGGLGYEFVPSNRMDEALNPPVDSAEGSPRKEPSQQFGQHQFGPIAVLNVGGMNHDGQQQPHGAHYDAALASGYPFASVIASRPSFSVVFTDWLSMMLRVDDAEGR